MSGYIPRNPTASEWGTIVRELRGDLKLSQDAFAKRARTTTRTVQRWEQGENLPAEPVRMFVLTMRRSQTARRSRAARGE